MLASFSHCPRPTPIQNRRGFYTVEESEPIVQRIMRTCELLLVEAQVLSRNEQNWYIIGGYPPIQVVKVVVDFHL